MPHFDPTTGLPMHNGQGPAYDCQHCSCKCCCGVICGKTPCQLKITGFDLSGFKTWWDAEVITASYWACESGCGSRTQAYRVKDDTALDLSAVDIILEYSSAANAPNRCRWTVSRSLASVVFETGGNAFYPLGGSDPVWTDSTDPVLNITVTLTSNGDGTLTREIVATVSGFRMEGGGGSESTCPNFAIVYYNSTQLSCPTAFSSATALPNQHVNRERHWCTVSPGTCILIGDYCYPPGTVAAPGELSIQPHSYVDGCNRTTCTDDCGDATPLVPCTTCPAPCNDPVYYTGCNPPKAGDPSGTQINPATGNPWLTYLIGSTDVGGTPLDFVIGLNDYTPPGTCDSSDISGCLYCHQADAFSIKIRIYCDANTWYLTIFFPFSFGACALTCTQPHTGTDCCPPTSWSTTAIGTPCSGASLFTATLVYEYNLNELK